MSTKRSKKRCSQREAEVKDKGGKGVGYVPCAGTLKNGYLTERVPVTERTAVGTNRGVGLEALQV